MPTSIDHLVWAASDLESLVIEATDRLGITPVVGGQHRGWGTRNYLLGLGGKCYLELIGPDPEQVAQQLPRPFHVDELSSPELVSWAIRTDAIDQTVADARQAGYDPGPPSGMSRQRPDGVELTWRLTPPATRRGDIMPFVIDWGSTEHPATALPSVELTSLTLRHPDPELISARLRALALENGATDVQVVRSGKPGLAASFSGPNGTTTIG